MNYIKEGFNKEFDAPIEALDADERRKEILPEIVIDMAEINNQPEPEGDALIKKAVSYQRHWQAIPTAYLWQSYLAAVQENTGRYITVSSVIQAWRKIVMPKFQRDRSIEQTREIIDIPKQDMPEGFKNKFDKLVEKFEANGEKPEDAGESK